MTDEELKRIKEMGREGEELARIFLKAKGYVVQSPDWLGLKNGELTCFEVKMMHGAIMQQDPFDPGCFPLDNAQFELRRLLQKYNIRTYVLIYDKEKRRIFGQYLDVLENNYMHKNNKWTAYSVSDFEMCGNF